jgi:hypothetical protein
VGMQSGSTYSFIPSLAFLLKEVTVCPMFRAMGAVGRSCQPTPKSLATCRDRLSVVLPEWHDHADQSYTIRTLPVGDLDPARPTLCVGLEPFLSGVKPEADFDHEYRPELLPSLLPSCIASMTRRGLVVQSGPQVGA